MNIKALLCVCLLASAQAFGAQPKWEHCTIFVDTQYMSGECQVKEDPRLGVVLVGLRQKGEVVAVFLVLEDGSLKPLWVSDALKLSLPPVKA